ncbi:MAG: hypothetical protein U9O66_00045, partial [Patescibacteria group bacterium]|nr:hypothetical protein [Patescibacteria group bacterium]
FLKSLNYQLVISEEREFINNTRRERVKFIKKWYNKSTYEAGRNSQSRKGIKQILYLSPRINIRLYPSLTALRTLAGFCFGKKLKK